ncbi:hypothetical protein H7F15_04025 [Pontibacter sp. Tf4]|uniref:hypothetical protein n=1 Tax=Pontibacter sp. Tf4 TaxID=2761620 RepID=UPI0016231AC4|nr:hypothetical protein [Pontibacter sp. Tf4]MBB6610197.1 hypothetical protein [Pontibacter sp. Tf4]
MKNLNLPVIIGILFSTIGLVSLFLTGQALTAAVWLSFGNGLLLSNLQFNRLNEYGQQEKQPIPKVRVYTGIFLIVLAVLLLLLQIYQDFQQTA